MIPRPRRCSGRRRPRGAVGSGGAASTPSGAICRDGSVRLAGPASPSTSPTAPRAPRCGGLLRALPVCRAGAAPPGLRRDRPHLRAALGRGWTSPSGRRGRTSAAPRGLPGRIGEWFTGVHRRRDVQARLQHRRHRLCELIAVPTIADIRRPTDWRAGWPLVPQLDVQASSFKAIVTGRASRRRGGTTNDPAKYPSRRSPRRTNDRVVDRVAQSAARRQLRDRGRVILGDPAGFAMDWLEWRRDTLGSRSSTGTPQRPAGHDRDVDARQLLHGGRPRRDESPLKFWIGIARGPDDSNTVAGGGSFDRPTIPAINALGTLGAGAVALTGLRNSTST